MSYRVISLLTLLLVAACVVTVPGARAGELSHARIVRLSYTQGEVQYRSDADARWENAMVNTPLHEGMSLATGDGRAEVEFESGAMLWMAPNTVVEFERLALDEGAKLTQMGVKQGTATIYVKPGKHDSFAVLAGGLLVAARESARFRVDVFEDGAAVSVLHGAVEATSQGEAQRVDGHKTLAVRYGAAAGATVSANPHSDAWDRWVSDRNDAVVAARINTTDTLSSPFDMGMADLSLYGGWVEAGNYGLGWVPYGVGAGWSPFFNGYWDSFGAFGPTWVSYEPWGWLPYHYGGWFFSPIYGWVWVPGNLGAAAWSPATVAWVRTPRGIGWVARGPRDTGTGTPANLPRGVITNTPAGMLAGTRNTILRGAKLTGVRAVGTWTDDAELVRFARQGGAQGHAAGPAAGSVRPAMRMPEGPAPRISTAGFYQGRQERYRPEQAGTTAGFGGNSGRGTGFGGPGVRSPGMAGGGRGHGEAAPVRGGSGGTRGKP